MNKIIILGKGYIGNYLNNFLSKIEDQEIIHVSKKDIEYDNPEIFKRFLKNHQSKCSHVWVINCSGFTGTPNVDGCENFKAECFHYNVTVPLYITKVCNEVNVPIIHIGSGCVYSGYDTVYKETDPADFGVDCFGSSTYSKSKHAFEVLSSHMLRYIFRIRIPFNGVYEPKNYLYKLLKYDNLISKQNSITCVDDLIVFIWKFISRPPQSILPAGIYNIVNTGSLDGQDVVQMLKDAGVQNPNWKFVSIKEANFKVQRSNCLLSTDKLKLYGLQLPDVRTSMEKSIKEFVEDYKNQNK
jgi:dTDP-4-dehydrorhamnose reductase